MRVATENGSDADGYRRSSNTETLRGRQYRRGGREGAWTPARWTGQGAVAGSGDGDGDCSTSSGGA